MKKNIDKYNDDIDKYNENVDRFNKATRKTTIEKILLIIAWILVVVMTFVDKERSLQWGILLFVINLHFAFVNFKDEIRNKFPTNDRN